MKRVLDFLKTEVKIPMWEFTILGFFLGYGGTSLIYDIRDNIKETIRFRRWKREYIRKQAETEED